MRYNNTELQSGLDYQIPATFINPQAPAQVGPQAVQPTGVYGGQQDTLANRGKLTQDYYNNYGALDSFAKEMSRQGINVFAPDYTQEGGGVPFQVAQQLQASVLHAANALKGEFEMQKTLAPYEAKGDIRRVSGVDPNSLMYSDAQNFYGTAANPGIQEANFRNRENLYTQGDSNRRNAETSQVLARIDQQVAQGQMSPDEGEYQKSLYIKNTPQAFLYRPNTYDQKAAEKQKAIEKRAELIRQLKGGILSNDEGVLNILKRIPGVEDAEYVHTPKEVGIRVYSKDQGPSFIDLTKGGANDLNALLSRIEGQYNIANEDLIPHNTYVQLPESNAAQVVEPVKQAFISASTAGNSQDPSFAKLKEIAKQGKLVTPENTLLADIEVRTNWLGTPKLDITYYVNDKNGRPTSRTSTKTIDLEDNPDYVSQLFDQNENVIGKSLGVGFGETQAPQTQPQGKRVSRATIQSKIGQPEYEGYTLDELIQYYASQGYEVY